MVNFVFSEMPPVEGATAQGLPRETAAHRRMARSLTSEFHLEPRVAEAAEEIMIDFMRREGRPLAGRFIYFSTRVKSGNIL